MEILKYFLTFLFMFILIVLMDYLWLGVVLKNFIIEQFGTLVKVKGGAIDINLSAGLVVWLVIALGCMFFVVFSGESYLQIFGYGALLGFVIYFTYDFTNITFIKDYPIKFAIIDVFWGTFLCGTISLAGFWFYNFIGKFL